METETVDSIALTPEQLQMVRRMLSTNMLSTAIGDGELPIATTLVDLRMGVMSDAKLYLYPTPDAFTWFRRAGIKV